MIRTHHCLPLLAALMAGCASTVSGEPAPATATALPSPPRPQELPLDGLNPCALLTEVQLGQLGIGNPESGASSDEFNSPLCQWSRFPDEPRDLFLIRLLIHRPAEYALGSTTGAQVRTIAGFATVETVSPDAPPDRNCVLVVDVAEGQSLVVVYDYAGLTVPMTTTLACEKATAAAELMIQTLARGAAG